MSKLSGHPSKGKPYTISTSYIHAVLVGISCRLGSTKASNNRYHLNFGISLLNKLFKKISNGYDKNFSKLVNGKFTQCWQNLKMEVIFRTAFGQEIELAFKSECCNIFTIKTKLAENFGIPPEEITLYYRGYVLEDDTKLEQLNIEEEIYVRFHKRKLSQGDFEKEKDYEEEIPKSSKEEPSESKEKPAKVRVVEVEKPNTSEKPTIEKSIEHLTGFGFTKSQAKRALDISGGNVDLALEILLDGGIPDSTSGYKPPYSGPITEKDFDFETMRAMLTPAQKALSTKLKNEGYDADLVIQIVQIASDEQSAREMLE